jgi:hypothetical protein
VVAAVVVLLLLVSVLIAEITSPEGSSDAAGASAAPPAAAVPTTESSESAPEPPGFRDGTFLVGVDIQPGLYRTAGTTRCYWERLSGLSGDFGDILANGAPTGQAYVEILPTDTAFSTDDCGRWAPAIADGPDVSGGFGDGTYVVGSDVPPGTYRATGGSGCYWERLSDLTGNFDAILANEATDGPSAVTLDGSEAAFSTEGCGTWSRIG